MSFCNAHICDLVMFEISFGLSISDVYTVGVLKYFLALKNEQKAYCSFYALKNRA